MEKKRIKVLLVEDDKVDQMAFIRLIKNENLFYDYTIAGSASEAKEILNSKIFNIVITDYNLGDGIAFDIFDFVTDAPIILVIGVGDEEVAVKAMKAGAYDYLIKDHQRNYLKVLPLTVANAIKRKEMEDAHKRMEEEREKLIAELQESLTKVKTLRGLIPICASCKKVRNDKGYWDEVESYVSKYSDAVFSHGICPDCLEKLYPEQYKRLKEKGKISDNAQTHATESPEEQDI